MKSKCRKWGTIVCVAVFLFVATADAQRVPRKQRSNAARAPQPTTAPQPSPGYAYGGLPIIFDSTLLADPGPQASRRPTSTFDVPDSFKRRMVLEPEHLRWDDALYVQRVWRELDLREKLNQPFRYEGSDDKGSQLFVDILLDQIKSGKLTAFADERFSEPLSPSQIDDLTRGKLDTVPVYGTDIDAPTHYLVTRSRFDPKSVTRLRMVEEWIFDKEASRMFVRVIGLAALKTEYVPSTTVERGQSVLFWVHFPDLRPILAQYEVYNPKNMGQARMTWLELFESRMFSSFIVKSTLDNPGNKPIRAYIKDPILALVEGDNIKNKIFNYEQDLWSY